MLTSALIQWKDPSIVLADWIQANYPYPRREWMTHLKLQKLLFYCVGAAMAFDLEHEFRGKIKFEAWEHGPVNVELWQKYRSYRGAPLPPVAEPFDSAIYSHRVKQVMTWALQVYGALSAWNLRNQSHLEEPWRLAFYFKKLEIDHDLMQRHFIGRFNTLHVCAPEYLQDPGTFRIDGLPVMGYDSFENLAAITHSLYQK